MSISLTKGKATKDHKLVVGGVPRAELLPPELKQEEKAKTARRGYGFLVLVVVVVVAAGYIFSALVAETAQAQLRAANDRTDALLVEQSKYIEVRQLAAQVTASEDARAVGMAADIDWEAYVQGIAVKLNGIGAATSTFSITAATPLSPLAQPTAMLEGARVAEITFVGLSPTYPSVADWLREFKTLPGFADARISGIRMVLGVYELDIVLHINEGAYSNKYVEVPEEDAAADAAAVETEEPVN